MTEPLVAGIASPPAQSEKIQSVQSVQTSQLSQNEKTFSQSDLFPAEKEKSQCEPIGDGLFESMFNPNCGLDIYETCDENTWVQCKLASSRLGLYIFAIVLVIVMVIIFFVTDLTGKIIVVAVGVGLWYLARYASTTWIEKTARVEYQRIEKEVEGMMRRGELTRKEAVNSLRDEKLRREHTSAIRGQTGQSSQPAQSGLTAGLTAGLISGLMNRK